MDLRTHPVTRFWITSKLFPSSVSQSHIILTCRKTNLSGLCGSLTPKQRGIRNRGKISLIAILNVSLNQRGGCGLVMCKEDLGDGSYGNGNYCSCFSRFRPYFRYRRHPIGSSHWGVL